MSSLLLSLNLFLNRPLRQQQSNRCLEHSRAPNQINDSYSRKLKQYASISQNFVSNKDIVYELYGLKVLLSNLSGSQHHSISLPIALDSQM